MLQGTLLVIPVEESLLYVRPLYLRSAGGRIPELKRVIVAHQNEIVMEETFDEALARLFPAEGVPSLAATAGVATKQMSTLAMVGHRAMRSWRGRASITSARSER